jgi:hypothetical protein
MGIEMVLFDITAVASDTFRRDFLSRNAKYRGKRILMLVDVDPLVKSNNMIKGRGAYAATARLVLHDQRETTLHTYLLTTETTGGCLFPLLVSGHASEEASLSNQNGMWGFESKEKAKISLLWHILSKDTTKCGWIEKSFPERTWRSIETSNEERNGIKENPLRYVVLSLQNAGKAGKGAVFCTLVHRVGQCVYARMEWLGCQQFFKLKNSCILPPVDKEILQTKYTNTNRTSEGATTVSQDISTGTTKVKSSKAKKKPANYVTSPLEIDPFKDIETRATMIEHLDRWKTVWSDSLSLWKTSVVIRGNGVDSDRYWHPPGTDTYSRLIRSKKDLFSYLDYSAGQTMVNIAEHDGCYKVLRGWLMERKHNRYWKDS